MHDQVLILPINVKPSLDEFLNLLSVAKDGLASQLIKPIYNQLFVFSKDLRAEYMKYYSIEYPTFSEYLEICHNVALPEEELDKQYIFKFKNTYQMTDPAYDRDYLQRIMKLIREMEITDEN